MTKTDKTVLRKGVLYTLVVLGWVGIATLSLKLMGIASDLCFVAGVLGLVVTTLGLGIFVKNEIVSVFHRNDKDKTESK